MRNSPMKFYATRKIVRQVIKTEAQKQGVKPSKWLRDTWDNAQCQLVGTSLRASRQARSTGKHNSYLTRDRREVVHET